MHCTTEVHTLHHRAAEELRHVFVAFASFGSRTPLHEMDNVKMVKLCRDCGLLGGQVASTAVDLMFMHAKARGARRIVFEQFISVLASIAEKKVRCCRGCL